MTSMFEIVNGHKLRKKVRAVIENEQGQFLLIQPHGYDSDAWTLVGGGVELNESDEQAILREIREETGIDAVTRLHMSKAVHWFCFSDKIKQHRQLDHDGQIAKVFFAVVPTDAAVIIQQSEIQAFIWASPKEAEGLIKNLEQRNLFKEIVTEFRDN